MFAARANAERNTPHPRRAATAAAVPPRSFTETIAKQHVAFGTLYPWLLLAAALDIIFTRAVLGAGGIELNPTAAWVIERGDMPGMVAFKFITITVFILTCEAVAVRSRALGAAIAYFAIAVTMLVVLWSATQLLAGQTKPPMQVLRMALNS